MTMESNRPLWELERDVEASRARLEMAINNASRQMTIDGVLGSVKRALDIDGMEPAQQLMDKARNNPLPLALIGAGIGWLLLGDGGPDARTIRRRARHGAERFADGARDAADHVASSVDGMRSHSHSGAPSRPPIVRHDIHGKPVPVHSEFDEDEGRGIGDRARGAMSDAGHALSGARHAVEDEMHSLGHSAGELADEARDRLRRTRAQTSEFAHRASDQVWDAYKANPVALALGVAALGSLIGVLLPSSRREDELFGDEARYVRARVTEAAGGAMEEAGKAAEQLAKGFEEKVDEVEKKLEEKIDEKAEETGLTGDKKAGGNRSGSGDADKSGKPEGSGGSGKGDGGPKGPDGKPAPKIPAHA